MKKKIILWIMQSSFYRWLLLNIVPFIRFTTYYPQNDGRKFYKAYELLKEGDYVVTDDSKKLTSVLIPGTWAHLAVCVSKDKEWEMSEMVHNGYKKNTFYGVFHESTRLAIYRVPTVSNDDTYRQSLIKRCKSYIEKKYDLMFAKGDSELFCSELWVEIDHENRAGFTPSFIKDIDRPVVTPDDMAKAKGAIKIFDTQD